MAVEVFGIPVFFVEAIVSFALHEPDTVSRMGIVGKYFVELFKGWAILMSTLSLVFLFAPVLAPDKFKNSSVVTPTSVWILSAICFLAANFIVWKREHDRAETEKAKNTVAPKMDIRWNNIVPYTDGLTTTDLFVFLELVLEVPSEVSITTFSLDIFDRGQSTTITSSDDIAEWTWVRDGNLKNGITRCTPMVKTLTTRGDPVRGWLRFPITALPNSTLQQSQLTLKVNCEHGTCYFGIDPSATRPDPKVKGLMWKDARDI
jgi:hypothetical protein